MIYIVINSDLRFTVFYRSVHPFDFYLMTFVEVCLKFNLYFIGNNVEDNAARNKYTV